MKPVLEEAWEQIKGSAKKPPANTTVGLKDQLNPGKAFSDAMRQALGFGDNKPIPTAGEVSKMVQQDEQQKKAQISQIQESLVNEQPDQKIVPKDKLPEIVKAKIKANLEVVKPIAKPPDNKPPAYISGKPGYNPEKEAEQKQKKPVLADLAPMSYKQPRGSWNKAIQRKTHGTEIKGGRE